MYQRKFKGDTIDPSVDFKGSVANRSKLSICTIPPLAGYNDIPKQETSMLRKNFIQQKRVYEQQQKPLPAIINPSVEAIPMPKKRQEKQVVGLFYKIGKRISTIGDLIDNLEIKDKSVTSVKETEIKKSEDIQRRCVSMPHYPSDPYLGPSAYNFDRNSYVPNYQGGQEYHQFVNLQNNNRNKVRIVTPTHPDGEHKEDETEEVDTHQKVYTKGNQIYVNFSNESEGSLVSKLLDSYSQMNSSGRYEDDSVQSTSLRDYHFSDVSSLPRLQNNTIYDFKSPQRSTTTNSTSLYESSQTQTEDDLFSYTQSSNSFGSSEYVSLHNDNNTQPLETTTYNKTLPHKPTRSINQFNLRDYSNSERDSKIIDNSVPPQLPQHVVLPRSKKQEMNSPHSNSNSFSSDGDFYDCGDDFSYSTSNNSFYDPNRVATSGSKLKKKTVEIPEDTSVFTRNSRHYKRDSISTKNTSLKCKRLSSHEYLKNAGIQEFMLNGYQKDTPLKVINPET